MAGIPDIDLDNIDPDIRIDLGDDDDDDEEEVDTTRPFQPGASSTPYHGGEEYEMAHLPREHSGLGDTVPLIPTMQNFMFTEDKEKLIERFKNFIKNKFPKVDFRKMVISIGGKKGNVGKAVALGPKGGETPIFKQDGSFTKAFSSQYSTSLGPSAEELLAEENQEIRELNQTKKEAEKQLKEAERIASLKQTAADEVKNLRGQIEQAQARIEALEEEQGSNLEA